MPAITKNPNHDLPRILPNHNATPMDPRIKDIPIMNIAAKREMIDDITPEKRAMLFNFINSMLVLKYSSAFSSNVISKLSFSPMASDNSKVYIVSIIKKKYPDYHY